MKTPTDELRHEAEQLENPLTGQHHMPPAPRPAGLPPPAVPVDRARLLQAWESNVRTMRGVVQVLEQTQRDMRLTRWLTIVAVLLVGALGIVIGMKVDEALQGVRGARQAIDDSAARSEERMAVQEQKMGQVLSAMAELLAANQAEQAARAQPKDQALKVEAVKARVTAAAAALTAKKQVATTPQAKQQAEQKLIELRHEVQEKGLDVVVPAP